MLLGILSCTTEEAENPPTIGSLQDLQGLFDAAAPPIQNFGMDAANAFTLTGEEGTIINIPPNAFVDENGTPVQGTVNLSLQEIYSPGAMVATNRPSTSGGQLLTTGGSLFFDARQNGRSLQLAPGTQLGFQVPTDNPDPNMNIFEGTTDNDGNFDWSLSPFNLSTCLDSLTGMQTYCFNLNRLINWINCDYFVGSNDPRTDVNIQVPAGYDNTNTKVYVYFPTINSCTNVYSYQNQLFSLTGSYAIPIGLDAVFVAFRKNGNQFDFAYANNTIVNNHLEILSFQTLTQAQLIQLLQSL
jgi:hypothetical protein